MLTQRHCRRLSTHEPHDYHRHDQDYHCPGNPHVPHDQRCCPQHDTHAQPHNGCVLR